ncbi:MAG: YjjG family noncanonical pyrimidine nucleotidase [Microbacter sp.]
MNQYTYLLFDLDDTLWNFKENSKEALQNIFDDYQLQRYYPTFEDYFSNFEEHNKALWNLYGRQQITKEFLSVERFLAPLRPFGILNASLASEMGSAYLDRCAEKTLVMPHAFETLRYLSKKYQLAIISNGFEEVQYRKIERSGLTDFFSNIFLSEKIGCHKPDPEFFNRVLTNLSASPNECLVIGDNFQTDIVGAMKAGIDQVFYNPEHLDERTDFPEMPTYTIDDLALLMNIL